MYVDDAFAFVEEEPNIDPAAAAIQEAESSTKDVQAHPKNAVNSSQVEDTAHDTEKAEGEKKEEDDRAELNAKIEIIEAKEHL